MKTPKEILTAIKAIFADQPIPEPVQPVAPVEPVQLEAKEYSLADGTKVMIDKLEVGGLVTLNDAPAPMGEHLLADGSKIKLDEAGAIIEIEAAAPAAPAVEPEVMAAPVLMRDERVDVLQAELTKVKQGFAQLVSLVEALTETPAAEPLEPQKTQFNAIAETKKERLTAMKNKLNQIKNQ